MFAEVRMLTTDAHGVEILVGLTPDESEWYVAHAWARTDDTSSMGTTSQRAADGGRYLALHDRMKLAQIQVLGVEHVLDTEKPTRN